MQRSLTWLAAKWCDTQGHACSWYSICSILRYLRANCGFSTTAFCSLCLSHCMRPVCCMTCSSHLLHTAKADCGLIRFPASRMVDFQQPQQENHHMDTNICACWIENRNLYTCTCIKRKWEHSIPTVWNRITKFHCRKSAGKAQLLHKFVSCSWSVIATDWIEN